MKTVLLKEVGHILGTRLLGQSVRQNIEEIRVAEPSEDISVDFAGVEMITVSFADEAFAKLAPRKKRRGQSRLVFTNYNETVGAVLSYSIARRRAS